MTGLDWNIYEVQAGARVAVWGVVPVERAGTPADAVAVFLRIYPEFGHLDLIGARD